MQLWSRVRTVPDGAGAAGDRELGRRRGGGAERDGGGVDVGDGDGLRRRWAHRAGRRRSRRGRGSPTSGPASLPATPNSAVPEAGVVAGGVEDPERVAGGAAGDLVQRGAAVTEVAGRCRRREGRVPAQEAAGTGGAEDAARRRGGEVARRARGRDAADVLGADVGRDAACGVGGQRLGAERVPEAVGRVRAEAAGDLDPDASEDHPVGCGRGAVDEGALGREAHAGLAGQRAEAAGRGDEVGVGERVEELVREVGREDRRRGRVERRRWRARRSSGRPGRGTGRPGCRPRPGTRRGSRWRPPPWATPPPPPRPGRRRSCDDHREQPCREQDHPHQDPQEPAVGPSHGRPRPGVSSSCTLRSSSTDSWCRTPIPRCPTERPTPGPHATEVGREPTDGHLRVSHGPVRVSSDHWAYDGAARSDGHGARRRGRAGSPLQDKGFRRSERSAAAARRRERCVATSASVVTDRGRRRQRSRGRLAGGEYALRRRRSYRRYDR